MASEVRPTQECPQCTAVVPVDPGWRPWCECGWNVAVSRDARPKGRLAKLYDALGAKHGAALYDDVRRDGAQRPETGGRTILLMALSVAVVASWIAFPVAAVVLAGTDIRFRWIGVAILLLFAWGLRPRTPVVEDLTEISPASHPRLLALVAEVSAAVGAKPPERVALSEDYNAFAGRLGVRRRSTLILGVPLVAALEPQELVAALGHEMGHFVNGDSARSVLVDAAFDVLGGWRAVIAPDEWDAQRGSAQQLASMVMWGLSWVPWLAEAGLVHLFWSASQRAEYYADRLGAMVGGSPAAVSGHVRLLDVDLLTTALHRVVVARSGRRPLEEFRDLLGTLPLRERERRRRAAAAEPTALDRTHPPTGNRIRVLRDGPQHRPRRVLDEASHAEILRELAADFERADRRLADLYRRTLYV